MLVVWAVLWITALLLVVINRHSATFRWLGLVAFCGGMGALASVMEGWIVAYEADPDGVHTAAMLRHVQQACSWTSYYGLPYAYLLFSVGYHPNVIPVRLGKFLPWVALVPILVMLPLPIEDEYPVSYIPLACWAIPYMLVGTGLVLTKRVNHPAERRAHLIVTAAVLPAVLFALAMNYAMPLFGVYRLWRYNVWSIPIAFLIFITSLFKYGFMGVQLMIERRRLDYSMRAITSGTAMLNHAIKNDMAKIKLFADKIKRAGAEDADLLQDTAVIMRSAEHIEAMIRSVHERTQELVLQAAIIDLIALVRTQASMLEAPSAAVNVKLSLNIQEQATPILIMADAAQTEEAIRNVLNNAIEAMPGGGQLTITLTGGKRGSILEISDTGHGIERHHLHKVTEPFFTTKGSSRTMNFGLGLAYSSQLMNRQGGELRIRSERGQGTTVTFAFPAVKRSMLQSWVEGVRNIGTSADTDSHHARRG